MFVSSSSLFNTGKKDTIDKKEFLGIFSQALFNAFERYDKRAIYAAQEENIKESKEERKDYKTAKTTETNFDRADTNTLITKKSGKHFELSLETIVENIDKIKDKLARHFKRSNQSIKEFWTKISKKKDDISPKKFVKRIINTDDLFVTELEAQILYEYIDINNTGKITYEDLSFACKDIIPKRSVTIKP
jgi:Ca2+-binding EF-hand superfamily protein